MIDLPRRKFLAQSGVAAASVAIFDNSLLARAFAARAGEETIPWSDQPPAEPAAASGVVQNLQRWEDLDTWLTPTREFFNVAHYNRPHIDEKDWSLEITGLVRHPGRFTLSEIKARPRRELVFTLECSGNNGFPWFPTGIGTARWTGTPLEPLLREAQVLDRGIEIVFVGTDTGEEEVRGIKMPQNFARSMRLADAMQPDNLLCYAMNGAPLTTEHGFPLRLIAPGWYGIANAKWLKRIEVWDTRLENRFMGRDYVTIREEKRDGQTQWLETSVGRSLIKSAPARVVRQDGRYRILGMAWGVPIARVEVRIDDGPWQQAAIDKSHKAKYAWRLWSLDWPNPAPGEHTITSRAIDTDGEIQPAPTDPQIADKHTYWESNGQVTRHILIPGHAG
jgi:DMSO/TMAO reductase YedYZ molybdopterin-dependent catalytic subunit